ncbi:MAG TPA: CoA-binding protein [Candidatus Paceibacterota bacterium]
MAILVNKDTRVLVQGITGSEGARACREMLSYGTVVLAGVTPGKGGQSVENVPVYNSVREALLKHPTINASLVVVPARFCLSAGVEAISADIALVNILTEHVPTQDSARLLALARAHNVRLVGPSSVGIISPSLGKLGAIGSSTTSKVFTPGPVGIISKSGGMTAELALSLSRAGLGQSTAIGMGGDQIVGMDFADLLKLFAQDKDTKAVVMFGEVGGTYEEQAADLVEAGGFAKPLVALIAGKFTASLPEGAVLGHAGAIVSRGRGSYDSKMMALRKAGVKITSTIEEVPVILGELIK